MNESILNEIKKMLGIDEQDTSFDTSVRIDINAAFSRLRQLGVGPPQGFKITGSSETWNEFLSEKEFTDDIKTYIYLKTKLLFDPPTLSVLLSSMKEQISELEWCMNSEKDTT